MINNGPFAKITHAPLWGYNIELHPGGIFRYGGIWWRPTRHTAERCARRLLRAEQRRQRNTADTWTIR